MQDRGRLLGITERLLLVGVVAACGGVPARAPDTSYRNDHWKVIVRDTSSVIKAFGTPEFDCYSDPEPLINGTGVQGDRTEIILTEGVCENISENNNNKPGLFEDVTGLQPQRQYKSLRFATDYQVTKLEQ